MAATKKNNTRKKTGTRSGSRNKKKQDEGIGLYTEIILWITLAGSILLLLSNFGMGGLVGKTVSGVFFGLFGLVAYIFPIFLFLAVSFVKSESLPENGRLSFAVPFCLRFDAAFDRRLF